MRPRMIVVFVLLSAGLLLGVWRIPAKAQQPGAPWPVFRHDVQHTVRVAMGPSRIGG
jgi:hypothetical protein